MTVSLTHQDGVNSSEQQYLANILESNGLSDLSVEDDARVAVTSLELVFDITVPMSLFPAYFPGLRKLWLVHISLASLDCEGELPCLEELYLSQNAITSLTGMSQLCGKTLKTLHVNNNMIKSLHFGGPMENLGELNVAANAVSSLDIAAQQCPKLESFNVACNNVTDETLRELGEWTSLTELNVSGNEGIRRIEAVTKRETADAPAI